MKYVRPAALAATAMAIGTTAHAGGMAEPIEMAPVEIIEDVAGSAGSSGGLIVPLILIALIAAAASGGSDSSPVSEVMSPLS